MMRFGISLLGTHQFVATNRRAPVLLDVLHDQFGDDKYRPAPLLRIMVAAGRLGKKSGRGFYDYTAGDLPN